MPRLGPHVLSGHARTIPIAFGVVWSVGRCLGSLQVFDGVCGVVDMMREGKLPQSGLVRMEQVSYPDFLANRFGQYYA